MAWNIKAFVFWYLSTFMKNLLSLSSVGSLPHSLEPVTGNCPKLDELVYFLSILILSPSTPRFLLVVNLHIKTF